MCTASNHNSSNVRLPEETIILYIQSLHDLINITGINIQVCSSLEKHSPDFVHAQICPQSPETGYVRDFPLALMQSS